ncbi:unnamed protein product, partial [Brassica rapa]
MEGMATVVAVEEEVTIVALTIISEDESNKWAWVLLYWWLCEARVAATRMAKLRVDGSQLFGVALRANQFLPKRGFMDYQRLPSRVAMLPVSSFGSFQAIKHFVNMVMSVVQLGLFFFLSCVALDLYFLYVTCVLCNFCRKENLV